MEGDRNLFLTFLNDNIGRMNANSMNCKTLMAALDAGLMALYTTSGTTNTALWIAVGLTGLLYFIDCYYLMLEKNFRCLERNVVDKGFQDDSEKLFNFDTKEVLGRCVVWTNFFKSLISVSTALVYAPVEVALILLIFVK